MKAQHLFLLLLFVCAPALNVCAQTTYLNPILGGDYPDPTIMREGEDYYMTHSAFDYQPGLVVFHSKDLVHWEPISYALRTYLGSVWAPDICKHENKYYIYFTVAFPGRRKNYVVYSDSPYGGWSDPIDLGIGNIDPCHVVGEDGSRWLFMSAGKRVRLADDGLSVVPGTEETVYGGWAYPAEWQTEGFCLEGPKLRKIGKYYYYLNAEGGTAGPPTSHMVTVARSTSVNGPWENSPHNPLVHTYNKEERWWSKGHGSLIDTPAGEWMVVYHAYENGFQNLGRQTLMEPVFIDEEGWLRRKEEVDVAKPIAAPLRTVPLPDRKARLDEFRIGLDWKFYKSYKPERLSVEGKTLTLAAEGNSPADSSPLMFVAGEHRYEVEVEIETSGEVTAGIVLYYNADFFMGAGYDKAKRYRYRKGEARTSGTHPAGSVNRIWLRVRNDAHIVTGAYSYDGVHWQRETYGMDISGYHHNTLYDFQSVLPGIFAAGSGYARFSNFKYRALNE